MEKSTRKKGLYIAALICFGLALIILIPAFILTSGSILTFSIIFAVAGIVILIIYFRGAHTKLIIGIFFTFLAVIFLVCALAISEVFTEFLFYCAIVGVPLLLDCLVQKLNPALKIHILAFILSLSCVPLGLLGALGKYSVTSIFLYLAAIILPVVGIAVGVVALLRKTEDESQRKIGLGLSITAIAFPVLVVAVLILLYSTGVLVIRFM